MMPNSTPVPAAPAMTIRAFPRYFLGFPMIIEATLENRTDGFSFRNLYPADLFEGPGPMEFTFTDTNGDTEVSSGMEPEIGTSIAGGVSLADGEARTFLVDLSEWNPTLRAGTYSLVAGYHRSVGSSDSNSVAFEIVEPGPEDAAIAARLRSDIDREDPSWTGFLTDNPRTVDSDGLSAGARQALAYHLFLHRALYTQTPVSEMDADAVDAFAHGPLAGEAAIIISEIRGGHGMDELLQRVPGLAWRAEEGIADLRRRFGTLQDSGSGS